MHYAPYASHEFNVRFGETLRGLGEAVRDALGENLVVLLLGGGYGRGEGAVVRRNGAERPYNDLDLVVVVRSRRAFDRTQLLPIEERFSHSLGIAVDFSRPLTLRDVRRMPCCMMWQDLLNHHITIAGPDGILTEYAPPTVRSTLPPIEGTRLLLNRGAGLLWALRVVRGLEPAPDEDFVRRNYYKCGLALGDALLVAHGQFSSLCREREGLYRALRAFQSVAEGPVPGPSAAASSSRLPDVSELYQDAVRFKVAPDDLPTRTPSEAELMRAARMWAEVVLYVENQRVGQPRWATISDYVADRAIREPAQNSPRSWGRNLLQNLRLRRLSLNYPRESLYGWLPRLLLSPDACVGWAKESAALLEIWKRFN